MTNDKFDVFWEYVWKTLGHVIGILAVIGIPIALIYFNTGGRHSDFLTFGGGPSVSSAPSPGSVSTQGRDAIQETFHKLMVAPEKPCMKKGKKFSDPSGCSLFGLKLDQSLYDAEKVLSGSGFLNDKITLSDGCYQGGKRCFKSFFVRSRSVYLNVQLEENQYRSLAVTRIVLAIEPGDNPYFEPEQMRPIFRRLFGAPDETSITEDDWGSLDEGRKQVRAYIYEENFWVTFDRDEFPKPSEEKTEKKPATK